jgi:TetR/AcrR family transcriptional regulator, mexJK operon transcriptional repressor
VALGDAYLELSIGYEVTDVEARLAVQIDEAVRVALRPAGIEAASPAFRGRR